MAERKSGPVKPPVIDLKAREGASPGGSGDDKRAPRGAAAAASGTSGASTTGNKATETGASASGSASGSGRSSTTRSSSSAVPPPQPPRPPARLAMPWSAIAIAAVGGAVLGTALTYGMVNLLPLPNQAVRITDPEPRLATLESQDEALLTRLGDLDTRGSDMASRIDGLASRLDEAVSGLETRIAELPAPADLSGVEAQLAELEDRIAALGAGVSGDEASALAGTISGLEQSFASLQQSLEALSTQSADDEAALGSLRDELANLRTTLDEQPTAANAVDLGPALRLPLLVSGLETAFATGRGYETELDGLTALLPELEVPSGIARAAGQGLPRPDVVAGHFDAAVPKMLAARGNSASGDIGQDALEWVKGILAVRPAEELDGDTPDAVLSRLESAVGRRDFTRAQQLFTQLPETMQTAAGRVAGEIETLADAEAFTATLRKLVLNPSAAEESP